MNPIEEYLRIATKVRLYPAFQIAIITGMRRGEILGLRWKDVDLDKGVLFIRQTLSKDGKSFLGGAKTESSVRSTKISNETILVPKKQKTQVIKEKLSYGPENVDHDLVICTSKGTPVNP